MHLHQQCHRAHWRRRRVHPSGKRGGAPGVFSTRWCSQHHLPLLHPNLRPALFLLFPCPPQQNIYAKLGVIVARNIGRRGAAGRAGTPGGTARARDRMPPRKRGDGGGGGRALPAKKRKAAAAALPKQTAAGSHDLDADGQGTSEALPEVLSSDGEPQSASEIKARVNVLVSRVIDVHDGLITHECGVARPSVVSIIS